MVRGRRYATERNQMTEIGPVQMIAVGFEQGANFEGKIMDELVKLQSDGTIRILDLLFVLKDTDSDELVVIDHKGEQLSGVVGAMLGLGSGDGVDQQMGAEDVGDHAFGLTQAEIEDVGTSLGPGESAGFLLIEHVWGRALKDAIRGAGGTVHREGFLTPETVRSVEPQLARVADERAGG